VSAGRFRDRCDDAAKIKPVSILRQADGNVMSDGKMGPYHHLINVSVTASRPPFGTHLT
jgi:hypothetical protein